MNTDKLNNLTPQIDFYILQQQSSAELWLFACRFLEKTYKLNHRIFVHLANDADAIKLDQMLWTYRDISFIPHALSKETEAATAPIVLGTQIPETLAVDILVNLTAN